ncbi:MAG: hypothetical protein HY320_09395 [Armatimonadetes bacterium]|nr:hypothetical protein [Armatimonadota bacterium]
MNPRYLSLRSLPCAAWLTLLALAVLLSRLPLIQDPIDVSPDGSEYFGIARHLARGEGYRSSIQWQFATLPPSPAPPPVEEGRNGRAAVVHDALPDRPPLWPALASLACRLDSRPAAQIWWVRALSALLAALTIPVGWLLLRPLVPPAAAAAALTAFAFVGPFTRFSSQPLAETLFLLLIVAGLSIWVRVPGKPAGALRPLVLVPMLSGLAGVTFGLAYLTKPAGLALALVPFAAAWLPGNRPGYGARAALALAVGFLATAAPWCVLLAIRYGSPTYSSLWINFSVLHISEAQHYGFERFFSPPAAFIREHLAEVASAILRQTGAMLVGLAEGLGPSLALLALLRRRDLIAGRGLLAAVIAVNFLVHSLCWAVWGASRYMLVGVLPGMALLLAAPLARHAEGWQPGRKVFAFSAALTLAYAVGGFGLVAAEKSRPDRGVPAAAIFRFGTVLAQEWTPPGALIATNHPWLVNMLADRPAVILPRTRDARRLARFFARYRPRAVLLFVDEDPARHPERLRDEPTESELAALLLPALPGARGPLLPTGWQVTRIAAGQRPGQWLIGLRARDKS